MVVEISPCAVSVSPRIRIINAFILDKNKKHSQTCIDKGVCDCVRHDTILKIIFTPRNKMAVNKKNQAIFEISGGIIFHGLEYLIRHEVVFCFIF